MAMGQDGL
jgi:polysaccharide biosynthesis protein PslH